MNPIMIRKYLDIIQESTKPVGWAEILKNAALKIRSLRPVKHINITKFRPNSDNRWLVDVGMMLYVPMKEKGGGKKEFWEEYPQLLNSIRNGNFLKILEKNSGLTLLSQPHYVDQTKDRYELLFGIGRSGENLDQNRRGQDINHGDNVQFLGKRSYYYINLSFLLVRPNKQR